MDSNKLTKVFGWIVVGLIAVVMTFVGSEQVQAGTDNSQIVDGIYIDSVDVGGMTKKEAQEAINDYILALQDKEVIVNVDDQEVYTTLGELGFDGDADAYVKEALNVGKTGNVIKRYKELKDVQNDKLVYKMDVSLDTNMVTDFVTNKCSKYCKSGKNAGIKLVNGEFVVTKEKAGKKINVDETVGKIITQVTQDATSDKDLLVDAIVIEDLPTVDSENASLCQDLLGEYSTVITGSASRIANLANATQFINETVVYPGETFSVYDVIGPLDATNGYENAPSYENGKVVDSIGGGVCQVSTTLYNAVLLAEQEIVERSPHSMVVTYVDKSRDAAIASNYKDFKFKNTTDAPLYLAGGVEGGRIRFAVYGHETRPSNRTIDFESEIIATIQPKGEIVTKDKTQLTTYRKVTQSAHIGYKAKLWKLIFIDGEQTEKVQINSSSYSATPARVTIGTKKKKDTKKDKKTDKDKNSSDATPTPSPSASPEPTSTPAE